MSVSYFSTLVLTELVIVSGFIVPLLLGLNGVLALALGLGIVCADEIVRLRPVSYYRRISVALVGCGVFWALGLMDWHWKLALAALIMLLLAAPVNERILAVLPLYPLVFASFMPDLFERAGGIAIIVFVYAVTESCDSFALLIGKQFGRHKAFNLSPNKTLEGLAGGIVLAAAIGSVVGINLGWNWTASLGLSVLLACTTVPGDLVASKIKRFYKVKDFGNVLPLQGGVLDIYDSTLFNLPIAFACFQLVKPAL